MHDSTLQHFPHVATFTWPSFSVRQSYNRKIVKWDWSIIMLVEVLDKLDPQFSNVMVKKMVLSSNKQFKEPVHKPPLNGPVAIQLC